MIQLYAAEGIDNVAQNCTLFIRQNHNIALTEEVEMLRYLNILTGWELSQVTN